MRLIISALLAVSCALLGAPALAHPATELYIPIGQSPGVSGVSSYLGEIESLARAAKGFTMAVEDRTKNVVVTEATRIYLQYGTPGRRNAIGSYVDCQPGRIIEAYVAPDGTAYWIKIRLP